MSNTWTPTSEGLGTSYGAKTPSCAAERIPLSVDEADEDAALTCPVGPRGIRRTRVHTGSPASNSSNVLKVHPHVFVHLQEP